MTRATLAYLTTVATTAALTSPAYGAIVAIAGAVVMVRLFARTHI